uniref:Gamma-carboxyglutamic acid protein 3 n=1 Tax=Ciona intestinalis TaxID=7719 RepID=F6PQG2_CIOIN
MSKGVFVFALIIAYVGSTLAAGGVFVSKEEASNYLTREKRANSGFEEFAKGNFEQECVEEICNYEELREVYENTAQTNAKWDELTRQCENMSPCNDIGTDTCQNLWSSYACHCHAGYTGVHCETDIDECAGEHECVNCVNTVGSYTCACDQGYEGDFCTEDVNECDNDVCENGDCFNTDGSYICLCDAGYQGTNCSQDIDECQQNETCVHGICINGIGTYDCVCSTGYEGDTCNDDINECENFDNLCQNEGECVNDVGSYHCACASGYTGSDCSQDVNECDLNLCPEGSQCEHGANSYTCFCPDEGCGASVDTQLQQAVDP